MIAQNVNTVNTQPQVPVNYNTTQQKVIKSLKTPKKLQNTNQYLLF